MDIFYKTNIQNNNSLIKESKGLKLLDKALSSLNSNHIKIPKIYSVTKEELQIEKIESMVSTSEQMECLGHSLALLHSLKFSEYGLDYDNFIGLNPQKNILCKNWGEFFFKYRLFYQVEKIENNSIKDEFNSILEKNKLKIIDFLNDNTLHPSLVHGDLWSGNVLFSSNDIFLIDPAVYFADREVDIAMTQMFGGFDKEFYDSYASIYPLSSEYNKKEKIYNLYHFLNHYNLFGTSYLGSCFDAMEFIENI